MSAGNPLDDLDRTPWLDAVAKTMADSSDGMVVACSALARRYRDRIRAGCGDVFFVELQVTGTELARRMHGREHFMPPALLRSQLATWEHLDPQEQGASIRAEGSLHAVIQRAVASVGGESRGEPGAMDDASRP